MRLWNLLIKVLFRERLSYKRVKAVNAIMSKVIMGNDFLLLIG